MKNVIRCTKVFSVFLFFAAIFMSGFSATAQSSPKVIAVINRADWCPVCKANGPRVMQEVMPACKDMKVKFVMNDLTDKKTMVQSKAALQKDDVYKAVEGQRSTGLIILVDNKTKKVVQTISVAEPTDKIVSTIKTAQG
jgi:hypothetical protein